MTNACPREVTSFCRWTNYAIGEAPPGRLPLLVNMDETALAYHMVGLRGTVLRKLPAGSCPPADHAGLADVRGHVSLLASVTHEVAVQPRLPQVLLGNEHKFTKQVLQKASPHCPSNVHMWRQKSAWNSHATMRQFISLLARCLGDLLKTRYVILVLDCAQCHIDKSIYMQARQRGIRLLYIPPRMTRFLQPCDTHVFAPFKAALREKWRCSKAQAPEGSMDTCRWLRVVFETITTALQADWSHAFLRDGLLARQEHLSQRILQATGQDALDLGDGPPAKEDATVLFPKRRNLDIMSYVLWVPAYKRQPSRAAAGRGRGRGTAVTSSAPTSSVHSLPPPAAFRRRILPATFRAEPIRTLD